MTTISHKSNLIATLAIGAGVPRTCGDEPVGMKEEIDWVTRPCV